MKSLIVFVVLTISAVVRGAFWAAAAVEPVILGIGSLFAAFKFAKMPDLNVIRSEDAMEDEGLDYLSDKGLEKYK